VLLLPFFLLLLLPPSFCHPLYSLRFRLRGHLSICSSSYIFFYFFFYFFFFFFSFLFFPPICCCAALDTESVPDAKSSSPPHIRRGLCCSVDSFSPAPRDPAASFSSSQLDKTSPRSSSSFSLCIP
jgi:hypothetical protein